MRAWPAWSPSSSGRSWSRMLRSIRGSNTSASPAKIRYHSFLGVPLIEQGMIQGVLVVQTAEPRSFLAAKKCARWSAPERSSVRSSAKRARSSSSSRLLRTAVANWPELWWSWDDESADACSTSSTRSAGASSTTTRSRCCTEISLEQLEQRARQLVLHSRHQLRLSAHAGVFAIRRRPGARGTPACCGPSRSPISRPSSACTNRCRSIPAASESSPATISKARPTSDIPLIGIGLYYNQGYFRQRLDSTAGNRKTTSTSTSSSCRWSPAIGKDGQPVTVAVETRAAAITARVWQATVGRNTLLLLDSDVEATSPRTASLTARLYGGDNRLRIRQELFLGVGGVRALQALGISPGVLHLNEGHSAFAGAGDDPRSG